jgi:uncharacterized protein YcbK (DUF882 family)
MLLKPVTALALTALISLASFNAAAAPNVSTDVDVTVSTSTVKAPHHGKADTKKPALAASKKKHFGASHSVDHAAEPKESPKVGSKSSPKLAASLSTRLDVKPVSDKPVHTTGSKKTTIAATGKEVFIGGPTRHGAPIKGQTVAKLDKPVVEGTATVTKTSQKVAISTAVSLHGKLGPMAKSGRSPSRPGSASSKTETLDNTDDHPVQVSLHTNGKSAKVIVTTAAPCMHEAIEFVRGAETDKFPVTQCDGASAPLATERLSVLVRPDSSARPTAIAELAKVKGQELAPGIHRIDSGLLSRIQLIADHFAKPGMPERISIVSGYRPGSVGSYHASAQALDFHLEGVPNEALVDFCKTLENTGCGYYPNSSFVHVDVRAPGTGHVAWIDTSGPGETPHYVASWPAPPEPDVKVAHEDADLVNPYTEKLPGLPGEIHVKEELRTPAASINTPLKLKDWE